MAGSDTGIPLKASVIQIISGNCAEKTDFSISTRKRMYPPYLFIKRTYPEREKRLALAFDVTITVLPV